MTLSPPTTGGGGETINFESLGIGVSFGDLFSDALFDFFSLSRFFKIVSNASSRVVPVSKSNGSILPPEQEGKKIGRDKTSEKHKNFFVRRASLST